MDLEQVIISGKGDYAGKMCKCSECGRVERATFRFDYYAIEKGDEVLLQCERCFMKQHFGMPQPPTIIIHPDGEIEKENYHDPNLN